MNLSRRHVVAALISVSLLVPTVAHAQDLVGPGWVANEAGDLHARAADPDVMVSFEGIGPGNSPASLDGLPLNDDLSAIVSDPPEARGFHVVKQIDTGDSLDTPSGSQTLPVIFVADDDGAAFATRQRFVAPPPRCNGIVDGCLDPVLRQPLTAAFLGGTTAPFEVDGQDDLIVGEMHVDEPGTVVRLAGAAQTMASIRAKPGNDTISVHGEVDIVPGFGGDLTGFRVDVFDADTAGDASFDDFLEFSRTLDEPRESVEPLGRKPRRQAECPASGRALVSSTFFVDALGSDVGDAIGIDGLGGGADVRFTQLDVVDCGTPPPQPPFVAVGCVDVSLVHQAWQEFLSSLGFDAVVFTLGIPEDTEVMADLDLGDANRGQPAMLAFDEIELDLLFDTPPDFGVDVTNEPLRAFHVNGRVGLDAYGSFPVAGFTIQPEGFDAIEARRLVRDHVGKKIKVGARERVFGDCGFGAELEEIDLAGLADTIFTDGFESGDTSAWTN